MVDLIRLLPLLLLTADQAVKANPTANTTSGLYKGVKMSINNRVLNLFLNVTYGVPPVQSLRFQPSRLAPYNPEVQLANKPAQACVQNLDTTYPGFAGTEMWNPTGEMTESCLTLNIWAPEDAKNAPVLVWIFGGGFFSGSPSLELYNGSTIASRTGLIVININYRLGPLGFFYLDDDLAPPNVGLLDQRLALEWIHLNVKNFGGDPQQVTIFGESAGSASVMAHLHAPKSWNYFKYAIFNSGTMSSPWAQVSKRDLKKHSVRLTQILGCNGPITYSLQCLRKLPPEKIHAEMFQLWGTSFMKFFFVPIINDQLFFGNDGRINYEKGYFKETSVIVGYNHDEGSYWLPTCLTQFFTNTGHGRINDTAMEKILEIAFPDSPKQRRNEIASHYKKQKGTCRDAVSHIIGDYFFSCNLLDVIDSALRLPKVHYQVYMFYFNHRSAVNPWPEWMGAMHGYEIEFIFGSPLRRKDQSYSNRDKEISETIIDYFASFVRTGVPKISSANAVHWTKYTLKDRKYLEITKQSIAMKTSPPRHGCHLFEKIKFLDDMAESSSLPEHYPQKVIILLSLILVVFIVNLNII